MNRKIFVLLISALTMILVASCSALENIPLVPDSVKSIDERQAFTITTDENNQTQVQVFEVEGYKVTFYPKKMRIIIEPTKTDNQK